uniref:Uncharacterized protein n=1 Tax=Arundo donax TaxID=35708 RepID=A0A0A9ABJ0_ARUDO
MSVNTLLSGCVLVALFDFDEEKVSAKGPKDPNSIASTGGPSRKGKDG